MTTAVRAKARPVRETAAEERPIVRETVAAAATQFWDENGLPTVRKNKGGPQNEWDFAPHEIPEGVTYQWIRHSTHGDASESELFSMQENGWRPVPWERHKTRFGKSELDGRGCIMRRGQLLVERRKELTEEAMLEQKRAADAAIKGQFAQFGVSLPENVAAMGLKAQKGVARQQDDVFSVREDAMPKHEIAID